VLGYFLRAIDDLGMDLGKMVTIGGVGCTARVPYYLNADALHGIHGRTLAWATGIKLHRPDLKVVIFAGDGDAAAIGGNHLIQAARRNLDVTFIVANNLNFAMTGGQVAPTTPLNAVTTTTPYGSGEPPFDLVLANLIASVLVALAAPLRAELRPGGRLLASGFLEPDASDSLAAVDVPACLLAVAGNWAARVV